MAETDVAEAEPSVAQPRRRAVLAGLVLCSLLAALDGTIVATAAPAIVRNLGGFSLFTWIFSTYLLAQTAVIPLGGRLADRFGRRATLTVGMSVFMAGSALCGLAPGIVALVIFRFVQGVGAGLVQPTATTITGDIYSVRERARVQGWLASVWGLSSLAGPALGGVLSTGAQWRWIFLINLPVGMIALLMVLCFLRETRSRSRGPRLDVAGSVLLVAGIGLLLLGVQAAGLDGWTPATVAQSGAGAVLLLGFALAERRAAEPVLPLWVLVRGEFVSSNVSAAVVGVVTIGVSGFLPTYSQDVLGIGAALAGAVVGAMSLGWPLMAAFSGMLYLRIGFLRAGLLGAAVVAAGCVWLVVLTTHVTSTGLLAAASFVLGIGLGLLSTAMLVGAQAAVGRDRRGVATGANVFFRMLGGTVAAAVFGAWFDGSIRARAASAPPSVRALAPGGTVDELTSLLNSRIADAAQYARGALREAVHGVLVAMLITATAGLVLMALTWRSARSAPRRDERPTAGSDSQSRGATADR